MVVTVLGAQLYDIVQYENHLQHLTNWAWVLHGLAALVCAVLKKPPALYILVPAGVAYFVAAGIACIQVMDDKMLKDFEKEHGAALVHFANFVFHYLPPLFWLGVIVWDRKLIQKWAWCGLKNGQVFLQSFFLPLFFVLAYSLFFTLSDEYPGDGINFYILFGVSTGTLALMQGIVIFALLYTSERPDPERASQNATSFFT